MPLFASKWKALLIVIALALVAGSLLIYNSPGHRFYRSYGRLAIGLSQPEVAEIFAKEPDRIFQWKDWRIAYYCRSSRDAVAEQRSRQISGPRDFPYVYGAAQVLFNSQGRVAAFAWNREGLLVKSIMGDYPGETLSALPAEIFDARGR